MPQLLFCRCALVAYKGQDDWRKSSIAFVAPRCTQGGCGNTDRESSLPSAVEASLHSSRPPHLFSPFMARSARWSVWQALQERPWSWYGGRGEMATSSTCPAARPTWGGAGCAPGRCLSGCPPPGRTPAGGQQYLVAP